MKAALRFCTRLFIFLLDTKCYSLVIILWKPNEDRIMTFLLDTSVAIYCKTENALSESLLVMCELVSHFSKRAYFIRNSRDCIFCSRLVR